MADSSEHNNESLGSTKGGVFLKQLINQYLITDSNALNHLICYWVNYAGPSGREV